MSRLLALELRRAAARRLTRVVTAALTLLIAVAGVLIYVNSDPLEEAAADRSAAVAALQAECVAEGGFGLDPGGASVEEVCRQLAVQVEGSAEDGAPTAADLADVPLAVAPIVILFGFVVGASLIGAEWRAGTIVTQLTWESRRIRLLAAKLAAAGTAWGAVATVLVLLMMAALWPTIVAKGDTSGLALDATLAALFRTVAGSAFAAVAGGALAAAGRNTAAALGTGFAYVAVAEGIIRVVRPSVSTWLFGENLSAYLVGSEEELDFVRSTPVAGLTLLAYVAVMVAAAVVAFGRRDVTADS